MSMESHLIFCNGFPSVPILGRGIVIELFRLHPLPPNTPLYLNPPPACPPFPLAPIP